MTRQVGAAGSTSFKPQSEGAVTGLQEIALPATGGNASSHNQHGVNRSRSIEHTAPRVNTAPIAAGVGVSSQGPLSVVASFDGLNHRQQRLANGGNQFSLEPPDQGLCVGNGFKMEVINDVMTIWRPDGTATGVEDLNTFLGYPAQFDRTNFIIGPEVTDPSCYYDAATNRWFADVLTLEVFPTTGDFTGQNHLDLAVSNGGDPTTATWTVYRVDVQDDGNLGTPDHGCTGIPPFGVIPPTFPPTYTDACIGDYPHLGADANGIYLTTNEYSFFGNDFHGAQIYAFSKAALAANAATVAVTQLDTHGMDAGNSGFTIWPATSPAGQSSSANGGTEYFLSSNAADEAHGNGASVGPRRSNQLLVWSLTHTSTLDATLNLSLAPEHEAAIDSNDTRMQQVVFANGRLWGALDTAVNSSANTRAGIEWFVVNPVGAGSIVKRGYLAVSQNNVTYPAIAVTSNGKGVMAFTLVGRDFYPSAAFVSIDANGVGPVQVAAMGLGPDDGFTGTVGLTAPFPFRPRWGDYGAAAVEGAHIWIGSEYIGQTCTLRTFIATAASCGGTRTLLGNWDTRITEVNTGS
ncbi:MAG: hypothetical protein E6I30_12690 [Chloroflexi bacterium]|nr:MAG: hypothetical protein E6I30_12690 [Chloroflexota bacterium]